MTVELAFEDVGAGLPLVLLHGLFGSASNWRRIAKTLGAERRVISVDLRNHGASPWAPTMSYAEMAADVAALIDRLGLVDATSAPAVLGHSMGGKVAMALALTDASRVGRLLVVDVAPVGYGDHFSPYIAAMREVDTTQAGGREPIRQRLVQAIPDERVVGFLMTNLVRDGDAYDWRINLAALAEAMPGIRGFPDALLARRYDGPVTVIDGERSDYVSADDRAAFRGAVPESPFPDDRERGTLAACRRARRVRRRGPRGARSRGRRMTTKREDVRTMQAAVATRSSSDGSRDDRRGSIDRPRAHA